MNEFVKIYERTGKTGAVNFFLYEPISGVVTFTLKLEMDYKRDFCGVNLVDGNPEYDRGFLAKLLLCNRVVLYEDNFWSLRFRYDNVNDDWFVHLGMKNTYNTLHFNIPSSSGRTVMWATPKPDNKLYPDEVFMKVPPCYIVSLSSSDINCINELNNLVSHTSFLYLRDNINTWDLCVGLSSYHKNGKQPLLV